MRKSGDLVLKLISSSFFLPTKLADIELIYTKSDKKMHTCQNSELSLLIFDPNTTIDWIIVSTHIFEGSVIPCGSIINPYVCSVVKPLSIGV
jgi:hypothetical protein